MRYLRVWSISGRRVSVVTFSKINRDMLTASRHIYTIHFNDSLFHFQLLFVDKNIHDSIILRDFFLLFSLSSINKKSRNFKKIIRTISI